MINRLREKLRSAPFWGLGLSCLFAWQAHAKALHWTHYGPRPLGMGNAFVAVSDDYNALFYNPAGLARIPEWTGTFFEMGFEVSQSTWRLKNELQNFGQGSTGGNQEAIDFINRHIGENHHAAMFLTPHLIIPGFGIGAGLEFEMTAMFHRQISADLSFGPRLILPIAYAHSFWDDRLKIGGGLKFVARGGVDREFSIEEISAFSSSGDSQDPSEPEIGDYVEGGSGFGADFGILFTPIKTMEPTLGLSIMDLGGTPYSTKLNVAGKALGTPDSRLPSVNTGVSIKPIQTEKTYLLLAADAHATNQPEHYSKKLNLGMEWGYSKILKLQTGLHQGEWTAGMQFDVRLLKLRIVSYKEQIGTLAGLDENLGDRRLLIEFKFLI